MLMQNVIADANVHGNRYRQPVRRGEHAQVPVGIVARRNAPSDILTQAEPQIGGLADPVVQLAGFLPQPKFAGANIARHRLGSRPDPRQLVIVNRPGAIHGDVAQRTALEQIDDVPVNARPQNVRAHHQNPRRAGLARRHDTPRHLAQLRMRVLRRGILQTQPTLDVQIVGPLRQRLHQQPPAVEQRVLTLHGAHAGNRVPSNSSRQR